MDLRVTAVVVLVPARRHEEVHDVQPETDVASPRLLVEEAPCGDAADVALAVDPGDEGVRLDLDVGVRGLDLDRLVRVADEGRQDREQGGVHQ